MTAAMMHSADVADALRQELADVQADIELFNAEGLVALAHDARDYERELLDQIALLPPSPTEETPPPILIYG